MPPRDLAKHQQFLQLWEQRQERGLSTGADYARVLGIGARTAQRWLKEQLLQQQAANRGDGPRPAQSLRQQPRGHSRWQSQPQDRDRARPLVQGHDQPQGLQRPQGLGTPERPERLGRPEGLEELEGLGGLEGLVSGQSQDQGQGQREERGRRNTRGKDAPLEVMKSLSPTTPRRLALLKALYDASVHDASHRGTKPASPGCLTRSELANRVWGGNNRLSPDDRPSDDAIWRDLSALCREGLVEKVSPGSASPANDAYRLNPRAFFQLPADLTSEAASLARSLRPLAALSPFPEKVEQALQLFASLSRRRDRDRDNAVANSLPSPSAIAAGPAPRRVQPRRVIKGRVAWRQELIQRYVADLETLIRARQQLTIIYEPEGGASESWVCDPLGLVYYWVLDAWYLCVRVHSCPPGASVSSLPAERWGRLTLFRLDRINGYQPNGTVFSYPDDFSLADYLAVPWGVELGEPFAVKVRFEKAFDVEARVKRETAHRRDRRLIPIPGGLIYQDTIAGPGQFLRWLRAFGSSAEVLEPDWLREQARASAERLVRLYEATPPGTDELAAAIELPVVAGSHTAADPGPAANSCAARDSGAPGASGASGAVAQSHAAVIAVPASVVGDSGFGRASSSHMGGQIRTALSLVALLDQEQELTEGELVDRLRIAPSAFLQLMDELSVMNAPVWSSDDGPIQADDADDGDADGSDDAADEDYADVDGSDGADDAEADEDDADAEGFGADDLDNGEESADDEDQLSCPDRSRRWTMSAKQPWLPQPQLDSLQVLALLDLAQHLPAPSREKHRRLLQMLAAIQQGDETRDTPSCYQVIKGVLNFYSDDGTQRWVEMLEQAAWESRRVEVTYKAREKEKEEPVKLVIEPLGVAFDTDRFLWYVAARQQPIDRHRKQPLLLRVDRLCDCQLCSGRFEYPSDFSLDDYLASAWGVEVGSEPVAVLVRFWDEAGVIKKVKQQLQWRRQASLVRENRPPDPRPWGTAQSYLYHDVVQGLNSFRRWLRSFGSSAEALFPNELRQAMAKGAVRQWALYSGENRG